MPTPIPLPFKVETAQEDNEEDEFENLPRMTAPSGEPLRCGSPIYNMQDWFDVPVMIPANAHLCSTLTLHVYCLLRHVSTCVHMAYSYMSA